MKHFLYILLAAACFLLGKTCAKPAEKVVETVRYQTVTVNRTDTIYHPKPYKVTEVEYVDRVAYFTDTVTRTADTAAILAEFFTVNHYEQTLVNDNLLTLNLHQQVAMNSIVMQTYDYQLRLRHTERTVYKYPTKFGVSATAPVNGDFLQLNAHLLLKQKLDLSVGYSSEYGVVAGVGWYF